MSCTPTQPPVTTNQCNIGIGSNYNMPGFCAAGKNPADSQRVAYCQLMSTAGEWKSVIPEVYPCKYGCLQGKPQECKGSCSDVFGSGNTCQRTSYSGNPATCCFNDYACNSSDSACFSDSAMNNTCSPDYRDITSTNCQDVIFDYCTGGLTGDSPTSTAWLSRWVSGTGNCVYAIKRNLFRDGAFSKCSTGPVPTPGGCGLPLPADFNAEGFFWAQELITTAMTKYNAQGFNLGVNPGDIGYNPWQEVMYDLCCPYPGLCQQGLQVVCSNRTTDRISLNPRTAQWCGCHLPIQEYEEYSAKYNIPPQCSPVCNRPNSIPITGINGETIPCTQNVCIIDDVTVNIISSQVAGGITFEQVCGNCPGGNCSCIISNNTVDIVNSTIGGVVIPISEGCGVLNCQQTNPAKIGPNTIPSPCGLSGAYNPFTEYDQNLSNAQTNAKRTSWIWTILIILAVLILLFIALYFLTGRRPHKSANYSGKTRSTQPTTTTDPAQTIAPGLRPRIIVRSDEPFLPSLVDNEGFA